MRDTSGSLISCTHSWKQKDLHSISDQINVFFSIVLGYNIFHILMAEFQGDYKLEGKKKSYTTTYICK